MRYLYGDSAPFPHGFDFLATLERFLEEAARVVRLDTEIVELVSKAERATEERALALEGVETFHANIVKSLEEGGMMLGGELAPDYAGRVVEAAGRAMDEARRAAEALGATADRELERELVRRHEDVRRALEAFFLLARLPILAATIRMTFEDARPRLTADVVHEGGIVAELALAAERLPEWQAPRKAGEFVADLEMLVGLKRGLFRRGETLEPVRLDDYAIGAFVLTEDTAEIALRRRPTDPDSYVFHARLEDGRLVADVTRPLEPPERAMPTPLEETDRQDVLALWERLRRALEGPLDRRERLSALRVDGEDVFETGQYVALLERIVRSFSHTMAEVSRRSPNAEELSLKRESDGGVREELYVKKRDLFAKLEGLGDEERALFAPLGLSVAPAPEPASPPTNENEA